jgi:hypothetical protein
MDTRHPVRPEETPLAGVVFGMLIDCPHGCGRSCPFFTVRQVDLATTFHFIRMLSRAEKMWIVHRYENCPVRLGLGRGERRAQQRYDSCQGFDRAVASGH